jgi:hypothetical protein
MPQHCCAVCFGDRDLRREIIPSLSPGKGTCSFCRSQDVDLVEPKQLTDVFTLVVNIYEPDDGGKLLVEWLREDWQLFDHPAMDINASKALLAEILDDGEIVRKTFVPSPTYTSTELDSWGKLREELMYKNRYFPDEPLHAARLAQLFGYLQADDPFEIWYRARLRSGDADYAIDQMGAPPRRLVSHGRANPPGIPYLYLGSAPETAAAEIRPHTGDTVCVADFRLTTKIKAVDLRNPRKLVSPFLLGDENEIGSLRVDIAFLEHLGEELTRPVLPQGAAIDYIPSQFLCEFIKKNTYDGVIYRSSVSDGINLALFDPNKAVGGAVVPYLIKKVSVEVERA